MIPSFNLAALEDSLLLSVSAVDLIMRSVLVIIPKGEPAGPQPKP